MPVFRRIAAALSALALAGAVVGCGDTWEGLKQDTGENLERSGEVMEKSGEDVQR